MRISVSEFKKHCTRLLRELQERREPIEITNHSQVVAKVTPALPKGRHPSWGRLSEKVIEISPDFDEPLGDDDWEAAR